jgi:hypothetical protein
MSLLKRIEQSRTGQPPSGQPTSSGGQPSLITTQARRVVPPGVGGQKRYLYRSKNQSSEPIVV